MNPIDDIPTFINQRRAFVGAFRHVNVGPTVHCNVEADMTAAIAFRKRFNAERPEGRLTFNDMIIKAAANALPAHPLYTCTYNGHLGLYPADKIDIRFPVDFGENFLGMSIVRDADEKTLVEISADAKESMRECRERVGKQVAKWDRRLKKYPFLPPLLLVLFRGLRLVSLMSPTLDRRMHAKRREVRGTFPITNIGPAGVRQMEGPIVSPDVFHLMIAATRQVARLVDGELVTRPMMPLIAKFDHRITDVGPASRFLHDVRRNLEDPENRLGPNE